MASNIVQLRPGLSDDDFLAQPKNIEAEAAILGSALVNNAVIENCPWLEAEDFFEPVHGRIWSSMLQALRAGRRADPVLISTLFETDLALTDMDGARYLTRLARVADSIAVAVEYARAVKATSRLREVYRIGDELRMRASDTASGLDAATILSEYRSQIDALMVDRSRPSAQHISTVIDGIAARIASPPQFWSTGIKPIDSSLGGGVPEGYVIGLEARVKSFKSGCAHTLLLAIAAQRVPSCYIALEMGSARLAQRMLGQVGKFNSGMFRYPGERLEQFVAEARPLLDSLPLWFVDRPGMKLSELKAEAAQQAQVNGCKVFVLDYWQLVRPDGKTGNKAEFLGEVADWCAEHAHATGSTWIILSQENRNGESLGSDGLARACDYLAVLHKHEARFNSPNHDNVETLWMEVKFARDGSGSSIGDETSPVLFISPHGPHLAEI